MGDQVGNAVEGTLYYISQSEFERIRDLSVDKAKLISVFSDMCRLNTLYMIARAGSGHIGSSFSSMDIVCWLLLDEMKDNDIYFSSKGHDAPGYYAALMGAGLMSFENIHKLRRIDGLPGHPDINTECMVTNTGSLGMGISKAKGMVIADRLKGVNRQVYVMTGDGELQEGQFWESLVSATNGDFHEITVIIDHNKLQSDTFVKNVSDLGDLEAKLNSFGWNVERLSGHDLSALCSTFKNLRNVKDKPKIIIADTVKGCGVSFMEHTAMESDAEMYRFHSGAPDAKSYTIAAQELINKVNLQLENINADVLSLEIIERPVTTVLEQEPQRLLKAYSEALIDQADKKSNLVALDADLILDTGLIPFKAKFPERFIECGIAEQDMVSQAGGMALSGLLPVVHSFACFLSSRPNEQIYNNATEKTKIIYVGSLAGILPAGPGHSHQAVRDISSLSAIPSLVLIEPCNELEVKEVVDYCVNTNQESSYIRLVSIPMDIKYKLPKNYKLIKGQGTALTTGDDAVVIASGPVMLGEAIKAVEVLQKEHSLQIKVINLPWLNRLDVDWFFDEVSDLRLVLTLDNHYLTGGIADLINRCIATNEKLKNIQVINMGLNDIPSCGTNDEVLEKHGLDHLTIANNIKNYLLS